MNAGAAREHGRAVAGLLLAAGGGRRFGGPKAFAEFRGERLVERGARLLVVAGCEPVVVVLGAAATEVRAVCDLGAAEVVVNDDWPTGMASSLRVGLGALAASAAGACVVALVDQPLVTSAAVRRLAQAWNAGAVAAVATYGGAARNPVVLDRGVWTDVCQTAHGDEGARAWLRSHPQLVTAVACDDVASPADIDTVPDLQRLRREH